MPYLHLWLLTLPDQRRERLEAYHGALRRKPAVPVRTRRCLYCRGRLTNGAAVCSDECDQGWTATSRAARARGRALIVLAVEEPLLERLLTFDAGAEDLEDGGDAEPDDCRVLSFDKAPVRRTYRGRHGRLKTVSRPPKTKDRPEPPKGPRPSQLCL